MENKENEVGNESGRNRCFSGDCGAGNLKRGGGNAVSDAVCVKQPSGASGEGDRGQAGQAKKRNPAN